MMNKNDVAKIREILEKANKENKTHFGIAKMLVEAGFTQAKAGQ